MQAPEEDVEGCILHVDSSTGLPTAILCKGAGSFHTKLQAIKNGVTEDGSSPTVTVKGGSLEEDEAATV